MEKFREVNWSALIRNFIEDKISQPELEETLEEHLTDVPELPAGTAARWLRSDRESLTHQH